MSGRDFDGWIVLVTGASTGLGRAIAVETADRGAAAVVINFASSEAEAKDTARQVEALGPEPYWLEAMSPATPIAAPSRTPPSLSDTSMPCSTMPEPPSSPATPISTRSREKISCASMASTSVGAYQMVRAVRPMLEAASTTRRGGQHRLDRRSYWALAPRIPYAASKGAMITMTLSLARALAPKIRVNAVCPGYIDTPWFGRGMDSERLEGLRKAVAGSTPLKVASTAEDIAGAAVFLGLRGGQAHHRRNPDRGRRLAPWRRFPRHALNCSNEPGGRNPLPFSSSAGGEWRPYGNWLQRSGEINGG